MNGTNRRMIFQGVHMLMGADVGPPVGQGREALHQDRVHRAQSSEGRRYSKALKRASHADSSPPPTRVGRGRHMMAAAKKSPATKAAKPVAKKATTKSAPKKPAARRRHQAAPKKARAAKSKAPVEEGDEGRAVTRCQAVQGLKAPSKAAPARKAQRAGEEVTTPAREEAPVNPTGPEREGRPGSGCSPDRSRRRAARRARAKAAPPPSPKDLAAAHEYLLARSATRSEAASNG